MAGMPCNVVVFAFHGNFENPRINGLMFPQPTPNHFKMSVRKFCLQFESLKEFGETNEEIVIFTIGYQPSLWTK